MRSLFVALSLVVATRIQGIQLGDRRQALQKIATASSLVVAAPSDDAVDHPATPSAGVTTDSPLLTLSTGIRIPRVGYSLYKTPIDEVADGVAFALQAGVRHFDVGSQYGTNALVGNVLRDYVRQGPLPTTRRARQRELFVTHKISNSEQSTNMKQVMQAVEQQRSLLHLNDAIDLAMIHSPLTDTARRLTTYQALLELQAKGRIKSIGVANYGIGPLQEIVDAGLPAPDVVQLILSPFNQHRDIVRWAHAHGSAVSCSAWSKLSSAQGPQDGWSVLAKIAQQRNVTKAQVLVKWAVQSGYLCVPRSSVKYKIDRQAIQDNSWEGTKSFFLTEEEMAILNRLDERLPAGRLGIVDGWEAQDVVDDKWDPTLV